MPTIRTPVAGFNGVVAGVTFEDGVGETDNPRALAYFARHGHEIVAGAPAPSEDTPAGNASRDEWVDHAVAQGADPDDLEDLTRNELRERYG